MMLRAIEWWCSFLGISDQETIKIAGGTVAGVSLVLVAIAPIIILVCWLIAADRQQQEERRGIRELLKITNDYEQKS